MVSRLDWRSSDTVHGQRQEKEEDAGDEGADRTVNTTVKQGPEKCTNNMQNMYKLLEDGEQQQPCPTRGRDDG